MSATKGRQMREFIRWHFLRPMKRWVAGKVPRWLVYYCAVRLIAHATSGRYGAQMVSDLSAMDALDRWQA